jgi:hypothetical protein
MTARGGDPPRGRQPPQNEGEGNNAGRKLDDDDDDELWNDAPDVKPRNQPDHQPGGKSQRPPHAKTPHPDREDAARQSEDGKPGSRPFDGCSLEEGERDESGEPQNTEVRGPDAPEGSKQSQQSGGQAKGQQAKGQQAKDSQAKSGRAGAGSAGSTGSTGAAEPTGAGPSSGTSGQAGGAGQANGAGQIGQGTDQSATNYATEQEEEDYPIVEWEELQNEPVPEYLIYNILQEDASFILYGKQGSLKTFLALDWGLHVAAGIDWQGFKVKQGTVVFVAAEAAYSMLPRTTAWRELHKIFGRLPFGVIKKKPFNLFRHTEGEFANLVITIRAFVKKYGPLALIIFDTLPASIEGCDENSAKDVGQVLDTLRRLHSEFFGCCILAVSHSGKDEDRGVRGSSLLECNIDGIIHVVKGALGSDTNTPTAMVTIEKIKDDEALRPFRLTSIKQPCCYGPDNRRGESLVIAPNTIEKAPVKSKPGSTSDAAAIARRAYEVITDRIIYSSETPPSLPRREMRSLFANNGVTDPDAERRLRSQAVRRIFTRLQAQDAIVVKDGRVMLGKNRPL